MGEEINESLKGWVEGLFIKRLAHELMAECIRSILFLASWLGVVGSAYLVLRAYSS